MWKRDFRQIILSRDKRLRPVPSRFAWEAVSSLARLQDCCNANICKWTNTFTLQGNLDKPWLKATAKLGIKWDEEVMWCVTLTFSSLFPTGSKWVDGIEVIWESHCGGRLSLCRAGWHHSHRGCVCVCVCVEGGDSSGRAGLGLKLYSWASFLWKQEDYLSWFYSLWVPVIWYCTLQSWRANHVLLSCLQHWDDFDGVRHCCQGGSTRQLISGLRQLKLQLGITSPAFTL